MKLCKKCGEVKEATCFYAQATARDGRMGKCKVCHNLATALWAQSHPEKRRAITAKYSSAHPEKRMESVVKWLQNNTEKRKQVAARWLQANPEKQRASADNWRRANMSRMAAVVARRRAQQLCATPIWASGLLIDELYALAREQTEATETVWEVDHIVPLVSDLVCGLHVEFNLRVVPRVVNRSKCNRHWPDMPQ